MKCKAVRQCWRTLALDEFRVQLLQAESALEFVQKILQLKPEIRLMVVVFLWHWWDVRNKVNAGEHMQSCQETVRAVYCTVNDIQLAENETAKPPVSHNRQWSPSPPEILKLNCDGAFKPDTKSGAWGFIIRNSELRKQRCLRGQGTLARYSTL